MKRRENLKAAIRLLDPISLRSGRKNIDNTMYKKKHSVKRGFEPKWITAQIRKSSIDSTRLLNILQKSEILGT